MSDAAKTLNKPDPQPAVSLMRRAPVQGRSRKTVERIRQAAKDLLREGGVEAVSTNTIAERAGVNISTLYGYYPDKYAILADLFEEYEAKRGALVGRRLRRVRSVDDWEEELAQVISELAEFRRTDPAQIALRRAINVIPSLRELDAASTRSVADELASAIVDLNPAIDHSTATVIARVGALTVTHLLDEAFVGQQEDDQLVAECRAIFLSYIRPHLNSLTGNPPARD